MKIATVFLCGVGGIATAGAVGGPYLYSYFKNGNSEPGSAPAGNGVSNDKQGSVQGGGSDTSNVNSGEVQNSIGNGHGQAANRSSSNSSFVSVCTCTNNSGTTTCTKPDSGGTSIDCKYFDS